MSDEKPGKEAAEALEKALSASLGRTLDLVKFAETKKWCNVSVFIWMDCCVCHVAWKYLHSGCRISSSLDARSSIVFCIIAALSRVALATKALTLLPPGRWRKEPSLFWRHRDTPARPRALQAVVGPITASNADHGSCTPRLKSFPSLNRSLYSSMRAWKPALSCCSLISPALNFPSIWFRRAPIELL